MIDVIKVTEPKGRTGRDKITQYRTVETYREALELAEKLNAANKNPRVHYRTGWMIGRPS